MLSHLFPHSTTPPLAAARRRRGRPASRRGRSRGSPKLAEPPHVWLYRTPQPRSGGRLAPVQRPAIPICLSFSRLRYQPLWLVQGIISLSDWPFLLRVGWLPAAPADDP